MKYIILIGLIGGLLSCWIGGCMVSCNRLSKDIQTYDKIDRFLDDIHAIRKAEERE